MPDVLNKLGQGQQKTEQVVECQKTPVCNIKQVNRFINSRWQDMKGAPWKGSVVQQQGWDDVRHFVKHTIV